MVLKKKNRKREDSPSRRSGLVVDRLADRSPTRHLMSDSVRSIAECNANKTFAYY